MAQRKKIDAIKSVEEAKKCGAQLSEEIVATAISHWRSECEQFRIKCSTLLGSLIEATDELTRAPDDPNLSVQIGPVVDIKSDMWAKIDEAQRDFITGGNVGITVVLIASAFMPIALPVALVGIAMAGIWGARRGWTEVNEAQVKEAQKQLHAHLSAAIQEIRQRFLQPNMRYDGQSLVTHYFDSQIQSLEEQIEAIFAEKFAATQKESARLQEQVTMSQQQRLLKVEENRQQLAAWDELGRSIRATMRELQALEQG